MEANQNDVLNDKMQELRKKNLQRLIELQELTIAQFADKVRKHKTFIYALLRPSSDNHSKPITTKMAREIERLCNLKENLLDKNVIEQSDVVVEERKSIQFTEVSYGKGSSYTIACLNTLRIDSRVIQLPADLIPNLSSDKGDELELSYRYFNVTNNKMAPHIKEGSYVLCQSYKVGAESIIDYNGEVLLLFFDKDFHLMRVKVVNKKMVFLYIDNKREYPFTSDITISVSDFEKNITIVGHVVANLSVDFIVNNDAINQ